MSRVIVSDTSWMKAQTSDDSQAADDATYTPEKGSVHALTRMFGGAQDGQSGSSKITTYSKDGTETTTTTTTKTYRTSDTFSDRVLSSSKGSHYYSPTRTTKVTETTVTGDKDAKDKLYDSLIPSGIMDGSDSKTTVSMTETVVTSGTDTAEAEDKLFDSLVSTSTKSDYSPTDSRNSYKTTTTTRTSSSAEDDLYGTLLPRSITSVSNLPSPLSSSSSSSISKREIITVESSRGGDSPTLSSPTISTRRTSSYSSYTDSPTTTRTTSYTISSNPSEEYDRKDYSYRTDSYEYSSLNSPTVYTSKTYRSNSRSDDMLVDQTYSTSLKSMYAAPERTVHERDLCTYCRKPFTGDAKMVLEDMKINCHASCFKCEVCNSTLGHMKAGDSMWIYKRMVHCENCFEVTRDKWRR